MILGDIIRRNAELRGSKLAIAFEGRSITYGELYRNVNRFANALYKGGLRYQDRIAIMARNCPQYVEVYGSGEVAGFIVATINFRLAGAEVRRILDDCQPAAVVFEEEFADQIAGIRPLLAPGMIFVCIGKAPEWAVNYDDFVADESGEPPPICASPDDIAYLIYTSGTTGAPKGVMLDHKGQIEQARVISSADAVSPGDKILVTMPLFHSGAKINQMAHSYCGASIYLHRKFSPRATLETIQKERITTAHLAPVMVQMILDTPDVAQYDLSSFRTLHYGSAPMSAELLKRALPIFGPIFIQFYGLTENGLATVLHKEQHVFDNDKTAGRRLASAGQTHMGSEIRIMDGERICEDGEIGEIWIRSSSRMRGYWNNSAATVETLRQGWTRSGDLGYLDEEKFLFVVDRQKDMIVSGGENIYSREVEEALQRHPAIAEVSVIGVPDERWGESVKAVVVLRDGSKATADELIEHCRSFIASYKKPRSIDFVDELPRLANGKVDKKKIRAAFWAANSRMVS